MDRAESRVVAIVDSSPDTVEMLRHVLERAGFFVVSAYPSDIRNGRTDIASFMREHQPRVVVYDLPPPYEENWRLFVEMRDTPAMRRCKVVLTSTNVAQLLAVAGPDPPVDAVVGKPYDLARVVQAVQDAMRDPPRER